MICGRTLFFGLVITLSLLSGIARSADDSAPGPALTTEVKADQPAQRPAVEISDDTTVAWRRSHNETAANIRFIKPNIPGRAHAAAPARALATGDGLSSDSMQCYRQRDFASAQNASVKRIEVRTDPQLAGLTAAKLQQLIEQPQKPSTLQQPNQASGGDGEIAVCATTVPAQFQEPTDVFITDEPNNVADQQVVQAAASAPRQLWAAGSRWLQGIGNLFPMTGSRRATAQ